MLTVLMDRWPQTFAAYPMPMRPLATGIARDLAAALPEQSRRQHSLRHHVLAARTWPGVLAGAAPLGATGPRPGGARVGRRPGPDSNGVEPRDPLEVLLLAGDRDEYVERSFWHDAEADGVTFQESRVDGRWDDEGAE